MREYGSRVGVCNNALDISIESNPFTPEDAHAAILSGLADEPAYDLIQLDPIGDPDLVGLVIGGRLRATYRKADVYTASSLVAQTILDRAAAQAFGANTLVRNFNRSARGSVDGPSKRRAKPIPGSMESEPSTWKTAELMIDEEPVAKIFDDEVLNDTIPGFFDDVMGLAEPQKPTSEDGW